MLIDVKMINGYFEDEISVKGNLILVIADMGVKEGASSGLW